MPPYQVYLLTGTNLGQKAFYLNQANSLIEERIGIIKAKSSIYNSPPWGFDSKDSFLNQVLICETMLQPEQVLNLILAIEKEIGRERSSEKHNGAYLNYTSRIIDIDILFWGSEIISTESIQIPHPRLHLRRFTLLPLNEISSDFIHPNLNKSIFHLLEECLDTSEVSIFASINEQ